MRNRFLAFVYCYAHCLKRLVVVAVALNANRLVTGVLRGFDQFMNIVLDNTVDEKSHTDIGMVVSLLLLVMHLQMRRAGCAALIL